jgi:hypothetical protein
MTGATAYARAVREHGVPALTKAPRGETSDARSQRLSHDLSALRAWRDQHQSNPFGDRSVPNWAYNAAAYQQSRLGQQLYPDRAPMKFAPSDFAE